MLRTKLLHPQILEAIAGAGHGSTILIADSNYPSSTTAGPNAEIVYLNLAPDLVKATDVLRVLAEVVPIEKAEVLVKPNPPEPSIYSEFREILGVDLDQVERFAFYDRVREENCCVVIATGESRTYACLLLTIGVVEAEPS